MYQLKAREVLNDCRVALDLYKENEETDRWRVYWCATLALLRAVGNVLHEIDEPNSSRVKDIQDKHWSSCWKEEDIFSKFINLERSQILKQYEFNVEKKGGGFLTRNGSFLVGPSGGLLVSPRRAEISEGLYKGRQPADVAQEAVNWWSDKLAFIEAQIT